VTAEIRDRATEIARNDFHRTLLWLRSLEVLSGCSVDLVKSEVDAESLFGGYRSPIKA
jgi:hypothetical protein